MNRVNKKGSARDPCLIKINGKQGQFFILAAVIIAVAIVGLTVVYNTVNVGDSPKKFYSYSNQLWEESGAVVDYSLYSGDKKVDDFVNQSVNAVLNSYPDFDVFACYSDETDSNFLICDNYGDYNITVYPQTKPAVKIDIGRVTVSSTLGSSGTNNVLNTHQTKRVEIGKDEFLIIESSKINYTIDLTKTSVSNKYYFVFRANTTAGDALASQGPPVKQ
jgi:hypothetical protein